MTKTKTNPLYKTFSRIKPKLEKLGFLVEDGSLQDFINNRTSTIKFFDSEDKRSSFTINFDVKTFANTLLWSSKMTLRKENTILNLLLADAYSTQLKEVA